MFEVRTCASQRCLTIPQLRQIFEIREFLVQDQRTPLSTSRGIAETGREVAQFARISMEMKAGFLSMSEVLPYLDLSEYWTAVAHEIGQDSQQSQGPHYPFIHDASQIGDY